MNSFGISFASHDYDLSIKYSIEFLKSCRWALQGLLLLFNASYEFEDICFERKLVKFWNLPFLINFLFTCSLVSIYTGLNLLQVKNINFLWEFFFIRVMIIGFLTTKVYKNFVKFLIPISFDFAGSRDLLSAATIVENSKNVRCIFVAHRSFLDLNFQKINPIIIRNAWFICGLRKYFFC